MKILIVEDDFVSRRILQKFLLPYGTSEIAINGKEAIKAFSLAWQEKDPYELICLDIMMPEMDGQQVLKEIRKIEEEYGVLGLDSVKIIMTTALGANENIKTAFRQQCEAYLVKPIDKTMLLNTLKELGLIDKI